MDVTIRVSWSDGSTSTHSLYELPYEDAEVVEEALNQKLADYLEDAWPTDAEGLPLAWCEVEVVA